VIKRQGNRCGRCIAMLINGDNDFFHRHFVPKTPKPLS